MPSRRLVRTDEGRRRTLTIIKTNNDSLDPADVFLSAGVVARLNDAQPLFSGKITLRNVALSEQTASTVDTVAKKNTARTILSHFFQVFNMGISRGVYQAAERAYFGINVNQTVIPDLGTEYNITKVGEDVATGDPLRVAAGGAAMTNPATAEVTLAVNAFNVANQAQAAKKMAFDLAQEAVASLRPEIDSLILRLWNEIETNFSEEDPASMRRKAREWGVEYTDDETEYSLEGQITDLSGIPLPEAEVLLVQTGTKVYSDDDGLYKVPAVAAGIYDVQISKQHYHTQTLQTQIIQGETSTLNVQLTAMPGSLQVMVYSEGMPLPDTTVSIEALGISALTGPDGIVFWETIPAGTYNVGATHPEKHPLILPVTITSDQTSALTFDMNNV